MKCPRCEAQNDAGARFCEDCGARFEAACPSCGTRVTPGKKFCRSCGAALTTEPTGRFAGAESYTPAGSRRCRTRWSGSATGDHPAVHRDEDHFFSASVASSRALAFSLLDPESQTSFGRGGAES